MQVSAVVKILEDIAPTAQAESWDNVGLLWGDPSAPVKQVLLTNDLTSREVEEAERLGAQMVVSYHPPLFKALKKLPVTHVMHRALRANIAAYSPHTAWDAAVGGTNDRLCDALALTERAPLRAAHGQGQAKLVFFAPEQAAEGIIAALTEVGVGKIGLYSGCHFRSSGVGSFLPEPGSSPTIGSVGARQQVDELRVEMVLPTSRIGAAVAALRAHHPYDEPAFDIMPTDFIAAPGVGMGRVGRLPQPLDWSATLELIKRQLRLTHVIACAPKTPEVERIAVCAGAGGEFIGEAIALGAQVLLTGEVRHHDALMARERGLGLVATLHSNSERLTLPHMAERLRQRMQDVNIHVSACDADPLNIL